MLQWRPILTSADPKFMVKGHVLASALYGPQNRFLIEEVRAMVDDASCFEGYYMGVCYRVRDAATVTDAQVRAGQHSKIIGQMETAQAAMAFCDGIPN